MLVNWAQIVLNCPLSLVCWAIWDNYPDELDIGFTLGSGWSAHQLEEPK